MKKYVAGIAAWTLIIAAFALSAATVKSSKEDCAGKPASIAVPEIKAVAARTRSADLTQPLSGREESIQVYFSAVSALFPPFLREN
jgi:hypothetical protein